jgi:hypothetical protein
MFIVSSTLPLHQAQEAEVGRGSCGTDLLGRSPARALPFHRKCFGQGTKMGPPNRGLDPWMKRADGKTKGEWHVAWLPAEAEKEVTRDKYRTGVEKQRGEISMDSIEKFGARYN